MTASAYKSLDREIKLGRETYVENRDTGKKGRVLACLSGRIEVESRGRRENWPRQKCEEVVVRF